MADRDDLVGAVARKTQAPKTLTTSAMFRATVMLIAAAAGMAAALWTCSTLLDRRLTNGEIVLLGFSIAVIYWGVMAVRRSHMHKHLNSIRDSALW
jgi:uncharacterized membrane protein